MTNQARENTRKASEGIVRSNKMDKTIVVEVSRKFKHQKYGKIIDRMTKCYVHDENGEAKIGDKVLIMETRPLSKLKRWRLVQVVNKNGLAPSVGEEKA